MNTDDLRLLADRAESVHGRGADRLLDVHGRIATARRRRAAGTTVGVAVAVVVLAVGGAAVVGGDPDSRDPIEAPTSTGPTSPGPSLPVAPELDLPAGQTMVTADVTAEDLVRWDEGLTFTNEPGTTQIDEVGYLVRSQYVAGRGFCRGEEDLWYVLIAGGVEYGRCSPDAPLSAEPPDALTAGDPFGGQRWTRAEYAAWSAAADQSAPATDLWEQSGRMFVTSELPQAMRDCIDVEDLTADLCLDPEPELAQGVDVELGFTVFQEIAPHVAHVLGDGYQALANVDGQDYVFAYAIESTDPGVAVELPASDRARLVGVGLQGGRQVEVLVDGQPPVDVDDQPRLVNPGSAPSYHGLLTTTLVPAGEHLLSASSAQGEVLAVVVYEALP